MSFILDALKKSESDRQRQSGPSLFEVKVAPPRRTLPIWAVAIAVLLGINVIVISWMLLRRPAAQQPAAAPPQTAPIAAPTAAAPGRDAVRDTPAARAAAAPPFQGSTASGQAAGTAPAAGVAGAIAAPSATQAGSTGSPSMPPPPLAGNAPQSASQPPTSANASDYAPAVEPGTAASSAASADAAADLPLYQQIVTSDGLPALHLDLHVFANRPRDRFVMINMHRLGEGDSLPSGVRVEAIRPDGVVLSYRGNRFLLPRN